jgi:hypothetical protein
MPATLAGGVPMRRLKSLISLGLLAVLVTEPGAALAQEEEGAPPEGGEAETAAEPPPEEGDIPAVKRDPNKRRWGVGARLRYVFLPAGMVELFVDHATSMSSVGFGAEVVTRKGNFDVVFGLEYANIAPENGLYQEKGEDPSVAGMYPDYVEFESFALLALDASFIWHATLSEKVQLRYGAGIGLGFVLGDIYQTDTVCPPGTTVGDLDDPNHCTTVPGTRVASDDVPPVVPIVNVLLGARFMLAEGLSLNVEGGFRDVFYLGVSSNYLF